MITRSLFIGTVILTCFTSCKPSATSESSGFAATLADVTFTGPTPKRVVVTESPKGTTTVTTDTFSFSLTSGILTANGKEIGTVKAGDRVTIDSAGAFSINGQPAPTE